MPLYEYECDACGRRFELIRKFSEPPLETCLTCGGTIRKLVSSPAFQFKGTGWYVTDYPKKDRPSSSDASQHDATDKGKAEDQTKDRTEKSSREGRRHRPRREG